MFSKATPNASARARWHARPHTFLLPPGACIFSSAHSASDSASAAGAVLVLRSASLSPSAYWAAEALFPH